MKKIILFLTFLISLASCKTSFRISVVQPAVIKIPKEVTNLAIVNNINKANSPEEVIGTILSGEPFNGNVVASKTAVDGTLRALEHSNYLKGSIYPSDNIHFDDGSINWNKINYIADSLQVHGIIEYESLKTIAPVGGAVLANVQGRTSTRLDGIARVNIFLVEENTAYEHYIVRSSYNIPTSGTLSIVDVLNDVTRRKQYYQGLGYDLGYKAGTLIYPHWVWVNRRYYNKGSRILRRAKPMIHQGNWDIAEKQLLYGIDHGNRRKKGRIHYNLALVKEGQGDIEQAIEYAEIAALQFGNKMANEYLVQLRDRQRVINQLSQ